MSRTDAYMDWTATAFTEEDTLDVPEIGISVPVAELYAGLELPDPATPDA